MIKEVLSPIVKVGTEAAFVCLLMTAALLEYIEEKFSDADEE